MPHLIVEYSGNLEEVLNLDSLLDCLHATAIDTGMFPIGGIRIRAYKAEHYRIADCAPENSFVHVSAIVGAGRPLDRREQVSRILFEALCEELKTIAETSPIAISFNMREFDSVLNFKKNNLHEYVQERSERSS